MGEPRGVALPTCGWDVAITAIYYDSFGWHTREGYETVVHVYGFDILSWSGYSIMRADREFLMTTWLIQKADENERSAQRREGELLHCAPGRAAKTGNLISAVTGNVCYRYGDQVTSLGCE